MNDAAETSGAPQHSGTFLDLDRRARTGIPEVVFAQGKPAPTVIALLDSMLQNDPSSPALATRCSAETLHLAESHFGADAQIDKVARTIYVGTIAPQQGRVLILTAGTTDMPVALECRNACTAFGLDPKILADVGVAGLHRLLSHLDEVRQAAVLVVVAGMDGALPSVVAGLVDLPIVGVPTSVGYGVAAEGRAALHTMLASCSPGLAVMNIDNGLGAAAFAARILGRHPPASGSDDSS